MFRRVLYFSGFLGLLVFNWVTTSTGQQVRGVTDNEILVGQWGPLTGPAAAWGATVRGAGLFFKIINEQGGIHGRKIRHIFRDDSYQPAKTKAIVKELVEEAGIFAVVGGLGTGPCMAVKDYLMENKVPWIGPASGVRYFTQPLQRYLFALYPLYDDEAYHLTGFLYERFGLRKIAVFYQNDEYGKQGLDGIERYLKERKSNPVAKLSAEVTDRDLSSHALKLKDSGADAVILWAMPGHAALLLGESAKIGFKAQWATGSALSDGPFMIQVTKGLWAGMIHPNTVELPDSNHPLMIKYREWHKKLEPQERWGNFYYGGILFPEPFVEGLRRAGRNLTEENLIRAMETLRDWQGIGPPITYGPAERQGFKHTFFGKVRPDGTIEKLTDWIRITE